MFWIWKIKHFTSLNLLKRIISSTGNSVLFKPGSLVPTLLYSGYINVLLDNVFKKSSEFELLLSLLKV